MRVIAGTSRGRRLTEFKGKNVRPTPDRVREALFSILQSKLGSFSGLTVLDLFAGSGALAIEALSRGAESAFLIEHDRKATTVIRENIELCRLGSQTKIIYRDAFVALKELPATFDLIFLDPPYKKGLAEQAATIISELSLLNVDGVICAETACDESMPEQIGVLKRLDQRRYGSVMIHFYSISEEGQS